jgi:hypothetical protein
MFKVKIYRNVITLFDILATIGGLFEIIALVSVFLASFSTNFVYKQELIKSFYLTETRPEQKSRKVASYNSNLKPHAYYRTLSRCLEGTTYDIETYINSRKQVVTRFPLVITLKEYIFSNFTPLVRCFKTQK